MLATTHTATITGLQPSVVTVEVDLNRGKPQLLIIGLASQAVIESKERITSALLNCGIVPKSKRTIVNLAPADIKKSGTGFDLAIAVTLLRAYKHITYDVSHTMFFGELSLDGSIKKIRGILPLLLHAKKSGCRQVVVPKENEHEIALIDDIPIFLVSHLKEIIQIAQLTQLSMTPQKNDTKTKSGTFQHTFEEIYGQQQAKRALEIAAAGGHNVLLTGPPGTGKSMLAKAIPSILPPLEKDELLSVNSIYSVAGLLTDTLILHRPFRSPHHTISSTAIVGGGNNILPGEISLAHRGVLFMDEFPEFSAHILESLRQPLEDGTITISRMSGTVQFPCEFMLIAACNPCPCGYKFSQIKPCTCTLNQQVAYKKRLSGPIQDRIDLNVFVQPVATNDITTKNFQTNETSEQIRARVTTARNIQIQRYKNEGIVTNCQLSTRQIRKYCQLTPEAESILKKSNQKYQFSTRTYFRLIKVAQTIADIGQTEIISAREISEAIQYRKIDT